MLGSNFPVDKLHMEYGDLITAWSDLLKHYSLKDRNWLTYKTVSLFYNI